ncbi:DCTN3 protein, partial [Buphagus erythrorhynchus]|nr:DCTN3 protein [Buphagus erythrorhynchus]
MAAGAAELRRLQWRLEELEQRVGLGGEGCGPRKVADELVKVQVALSNIAGKRERIKILFKKIEDVIKYLDPQYIDRMAVPDAMKLQFILA